MVDGKLNLNGLDKDTLEALAVEFEFYSIDVPEVLSNAITPPAPPVKLVKDEEYGGEVLISNRVLPMSQRKRMMRQSGLAADRPIKHCKYT